MIFNSISSFIESVGRTRVSTRAQLDQMIIKWTGPTALVDTSAPGENSYHGIYTGMQVQTVRKIGEVAGVTTLEVDYRGRFDGIKTPNFGDVIIEVSANEGEIEYQQPFSYFAQATGTPSSPSALYKVGTRTFVRRFVGLSTTYRYVMNPKPAIKPTGPLFGVGIGPEFVSSTDRFAGEGSSSYVSDPNAVLAALRGVGTLPLADIYCSAYQAAPSSQDWYQVTETWSSRYIVQSIQG
jgi:hypothetical protein